MTDNSSAARASVYTRDNPPSPETEGTYWAAFVFSAGAWVEDVMAATHWMDFMAVLAPIRTNLAVWQGREDGTIAGVTGRAAVDFHLPRIAAPLHDLTILLEVRYPNLADLHRKGRELERHANHLYGRF